ncbi:MAG: ribosome-binding factor A [Adlercreutzia equolifaciens]
MKQSASNRKVNEQAREVIASILLFDVSDPRLHLVTITGCEVSYDRSVCNVYYTTDPERYAGAEAAFEGRRGPHPFSHGQEALLARSAGAALLRGHVGRSGRGHLPGAEF